MLSIEELRQHNDGLNEAMHNLEKAEVEEEITEELLQKAQDAGYKVFTQDALDAYALTLRKAAGTGIIKGKEVSREEIEKAMKDVSKLTKRVITDKTGKKTTVYVKAPEAKKTTGKETKVDEGRMNKFINQLIVQDKVEKIDTATVDKFSTEYGIKLTDAEKKHMVKEGTKKLGEKKTEAGNTTLKDVRARSDKDVEKLMEQVGEEVEFKDVKKWQDAVKKVWPEAAVVQGVGYGGEKGWDAVVGKDFQSHIVGTFDPDDKYGWHSKREKSVKKKEIEISDDTNLASLSHLKGKKLKVLREKTVKFASGDQKYYVVSDGKKEVDVAERFIKKSIDYDKEKGGDVGSDAGLTVTLDGTKKGIEKGEDGTEASSDPESAGNDTKSAENVEKAFGELGIEK